MRTLNYYIWLIKKIDDEDHCILSNYRILLDHLYNTEFLWNLPMDANRASDGLALRRDYIRETGDDSAFARHLGGHCSLLEMIIALSQRCEDEYMGDPLTDDDHTSLWFWTMIRFLGLEKETDNCFDEFYYYQHTDALFDKGDDLTLFGRSIALKKMQIWDQLMKFLLDSFPELSEF